ncbi:hypothetical protein [Microcoleus sp. F4-D5]|uniref:hypothetical protein n=1 Tax=Microcoleus sp. F4-D5 TaxID=2818760 RepID=UPI002FD08DC6
MINFHRTCVTETPQLTIEQFSPEPPGVIRGVKKKLLAPDRQPPDLAVGSLSSIL